MNMQNFDFLSLIITEADLSFHHIGLVVHSIADSFNGLAPINVTHDSVQCVKVAFVDMYGLKVELIEPDDENSPVYNALIKKRPLHHICFETESLSALTDQWAEEGRFRLSEPASAAAFEGRKIIWFMDDNLGLVEVLEK